MKFLYTLQRIVALLAGITICATSGAFNDQQPICATSGAFNDQQRWLTTWSAAPDQAGPVMARMTIRQIMRTSASGTAVRIRLSNLYGNGPIRIDKANVASYASGAAIQSGTVHVLTFNGSSALQIAKGDSALSDPVTMNVEALQTLAVSLYLPAQSTRSTLHGVGIDNTYLQHGNDVTSSINLPLAKLDGSRYFLTDVEVESRNDTAGTVVVLGDSITDGVGATTDNGGWTAVLAARLQAQTSIGVANSGIAGNRLLQDADDPFRGYSALARLDRDVLSKAGVRWVILQIGMNDIGADNFLGTERARVSAQQIIQGLKNLIAFAHVKGVKVIGTTLMPNTDADLGIANRHYFSVAGEAKRQEVNAWVRSANGFDAVIDFDQLLRDPAHPDHLLAAYDSGDHLHPNDAGHKAMGEAVNFNLFY